VPGRTIVDIPVEEQAEMRRELRQGRFGYLLGIHILLLCAEGRRPTEIAAFLFCSRSSVYRTVKAYRAGRYDVGEGATEQADGDGRPYIPSLQRSLLAIIKCAPRAFGWCRTRWSCATLAMELEARRGVKISQEKVRRWLHDLGYAWKRARHAALDNDPERVGKLARIRHLIEHLRPRDVFMFIDELDIHLLPKIGYEWMRKGTQTEVMTPGVNQKRYLAGALNALTGQLIHVFGERKDRWLVIDLLQEIDRRFPVARKIYLVADNYGIHKAIAVMQWLAAHPRFEIVWLPSYCPKANPIERAFGDAHDKCTRNHKRTRIDDLVGDVQDHLTVNGPWPYQLSRIYYSPEVDAAVAKLAATSKSLAA
jgi:putative transposase